jgi:DNA invertase Pin-like site-specific DNA recombinase
MKTQGKRAATLLRVSTGRQDTRNQGEGVAEFLSLRGLVAGPEFNLSGKSAYKGKQLPGVRAAIEAYKAGQYDVFVIRRIDRLDRRGIRKGWQLLGELLDAGVPVLSAEDPELEAMQDGDSAAEFSITAKLFVANQESKVKSARALDTRKSQLAGNFFPGGAVPRGYVLVAVDGGKRLVVADGNDVAEIFAEVQKDALRVVAAKHGMTGPGVALLVRNKVYSTGLYISGKGTHEVEPIVTEEEQQSAIDAISKRTPKTKGRRSKGDNLSGRVECQHGNKLYVNRNSYLPKTGDGCGCHYSLKEVHDGVQVAMDKDGGKEMSRTWIPGDGGEVAVARIKGQLALLDMSNDADFEKAVELRAAMKVAETTVVEGRWETSYTGRTVGDIYRDGDWAERRAFIQRQGIVCRMRPEGGVLLLVLMPHYYVQ